LIKQRRDENEANRIVFPSRSKVHIATLIPMFLPYMPKKLEASVSTNRDHCIYRKQFHLGLNPSGNMYSISDIIDHIPICLLNWPDRRPHLVCYFTIHLADALWCPAILRAKAVILNSAFGSAGLEPRRMNHLTSDLSVDSSGWNIVYEVEGITSLRYSYGFTLW
jgi:hypothetical protein